jgi:hypothetical protein
MTDILRLTLITVLLAIALSAHFLVLGALFPNRVEKVKSAIHSTPGRSLGIGLVNVVFFTALALACFSLAEGAAAFLKVVLTALGLLVTALLGVMSSFGFTGITYLIGDRLLPDSPPWKRSLWGSLCLSLGCALPFVGWFLLLPYAAFLGGGAFILGLFQRPPTP